MLQSGPVRALLFGVGLLLAMEGVLRLVVSEDELLFSWEKSEGLIGVLGDRVYVRESREHRGMDGPYPFQIQTNSLGLRDTEEHPLKKPPDTDRYLALGDSWIFGTSLDQGSTIPERLEDLLEAKTGRETVVVNAGIPGGSAFEALVRWSEFRDGYDWTGLILGIPHNVGRQGELASQRQSLFHPTHGAPYLNWRMYLLARWIIAPYTRPRYASADPPDDQGMLDDVSEIVRQASERGLSVTIIEDPGHMRDAVGTVRRLDPRWRSTLTPLGAIFAGHALNTRDCWGFEDLGHPGEAGAHAKAHVVAAAMVTQTSTDGLQTSPSCAAVEGIGPGKTTQPDAGE